MNRTRVLQVGTLAAAAIASVAGRAVWRERPQTLAPTVERARMAADGEDAVEIRVAANGAAPEFALENPRAGMLTAARQEGGQWVATLRTVTPGLIRVRVSRPGQASSAAVEAEWSAADSYQDGTPDFLRLTGERDRQAFRAWFTWLAEAQFFQPGALPPEVTDCASLIRYAYRGALSAHEPGWAEAAQLPAAPALPQVEKYHYPFTALGAGLFRVKEGAFTAADAGNGAFTQFADAKTLRARNAHFVSRSLTQALPGDLLFFRQRHGRDTYHSMIYLGRSQMGRGPERYVVYHTGPDGAEPGEIRRPSLDELLRHPQPEWRPTSANAAFLGVYRWNILRRNTDEDEAGRE